MSARQDTQSQRDVLAALVRAGALVLLLAASAARAQVAQTPAAQPAPSAATTTANGAAGKQARAFALFGEALTHSDQTRWVEAKAKLEEAFALAPFPNIAFELARVHLALSDHAQARLQLDRFEQLADPYNPNHAEARLMRATLPAAPELKPEAAAPVPAPVPARVMDYRASRPLPLGPILTIAGGGAALVAALMTALLSSAADGELARNCAQNSCPPRLDSVRDRGQTFQVSTNILLAVGAAAAAGGVAWWMLPSAAEGCGSGEGRCDRALASAF